MVVFYINLGNKKRENLYNFHEIQFVAHLSTETINTLGIDITNTQGRELDRDFEAPQLESSGTLK